MAATTPLDQQQERALIRVSAIANYYAAMALGPVDAADLAHDIVLELLVRMREGSWIAPKSLPGWVRRAVTCRLIDGKKAQRRREKRDCAHARRLDGLTRIWMNSDLGAEQRELGQAIASIVQSLPDRRGRVWIMVRVEDLSYKEVASLLGISRTGVNAHLVRAQHQICRELGRRGFDLPAAFSRELSSPGSRGTVR